MLVNVMRKCRLRGMILTQREVANALGVKNAAVSKWEHGLAKPRASLLPKIAKLYGCSIDDLLADDTEGAEIKDGKSP